MPLSDGMFAKKVLKASSPPAEAPMPTISGRVRPFDGAQGRSVLRSTARAAGSRFELPRLPVGFPFRVLCLMASFRFVASRCASCALLVRESARDRLPEQVYIKSKQMSHRLVGIQNGRASWRERVWPSV